MTTSLTNSSTSALQRASLPIPRTPVAQGGPSPSVEKPPLAFERPPEGRALWGSPHYQGESRAVSDLGSLPLDIVASYLPGEEHRRAVTAEPAFKAAQLMSGGLAAQDQIAASEKQYEDAQEQIEGAQNAIRELDRQDDRVQDALLTGAMTVVAGGGTALMLLAKGDPVLLGIGGFFAAASGATVLASAALCIQEALTRRHENNRLVAGNQALAAAEMSLELGLDKAWTSEDQLSHVDEPLPTSEVVIRIVEGPADSDPLLPLDGSSA